MKTYNLLSSTSQIPTRPLEILEPTHRELGVCRAQIENQPGQAMLSVQAACILLPRWAATILEKRPTIWKDVANTVFNFITTCRKAFLQDTPNSPETCMMTRPENRYTVNTTDPACILRLRTKRVQTSDWWHLGHEGGHHGFSRSTGSVIHYFLLLTTFSWRQFLNPAWCYWHLTGSHSLDPSVSICALQRGWLMTPSNILGHWECWGPGILLSTPDI